MKRQAHVPFLLCLLLGAVCQAAEPAPAPDSLTPLEQGRQLRARADAGDADAMMSLAELLLQHAPAPKRPGRICDGKPVNPLVKPPPGAKCTTVEDPANAAAIREWQDVGTKFSAAGWISKAAEQGNRRAMEVLCKTGQDPLAPAAAREHGAEWCRKLEQQ